MKIGNFYPAGANLQEIMQASYQYLVKGNNTAAFMINKELDHSSIFYTFTYPPSENSNHNLTFKYILTDGRK